MNLSTEKLFNTLRVFSKKPFKVKYSKLREVLYTPPRYLFISPLFFRSYTCSKNCGWCCKKFTLDLYPFNFENYKKDLEFLRNFKEVEIYVNSSTKRIYVDTQDDQVSGDCKYLDNDRKCKIYNFLPLSCKIEIIKGLVVGEYGYLTKEKYRRGWRERNGIKASCLLSSFSEEALKKDIEIIEELRSFSDYFNIEHWFNQILSILKSINKFNLPKNKIPIGFNGEEHENSRSQ